MQLPIDSHKHQGQRMQLVALLKEKGITQLQVIAALEKVPRHWFMDPGLVSHAYKNKAYPIAAEANHFPSLHGGISIRINRCKPWG